MAWHRRHYFRLFALLLACAGIADAAGTDKVLRIASSDITSLDPQQGTDLYSTRVASAIFEALYEFEYLSTGSKVIPNTALAMPVVTDDGKTWTIRMKQGIRFADDPAFRGKPRELAAEDYVYSIKRTLDPNLRSGGDPALTDLIVGARKIVDAARKPGGRFDYDAPMDGLRATDRDTLVLRLAHPDYTMLERLAGLPAPGPIGGANGGPRRSSCSKRTPATARSCSPKTRMRRSRSWCAACAAKRCRRSGASRSASSRSRSRRSSLSRRETWITWHWAATTRGA